MQLYIKNGKRYKQVDEQEARWMLGDGKPSDGVWIVTEDGTRMKRIGDAPTEQRIALEQYRDELIDVIRHHCEVPWSIDSLTTAILDELSKYVVTTRNHHNVERIGYTYIPPDCDECEIELHKSLDSVASAMVWDSWHNEEDPAGYRIGEVVEMVSKRYSEKVLKYLKSADIEGLPDEYKESVRRAIGS